MSLTTPAGATDTGDTAPDSPTATRRQVLLTGGVVAAAAMVTAACGSSATSAASSAVGAATSAAGAAAGAAIKTADVPVGGGKILADQKVVITQPTAGTFKAFSATCTHQGCTVADVSGGTINCKCHGSKFSDTDGSVKNGPASNPLAAVPITVSGDSITLSS
jgi:Rieske Fe-S protein